jgi:glycosyltransferase involved in cell wall biosynthesis
MNDAFPPVIDGVSNAVLNYAEIITNKYGKAAVATPRYPGAVDNYSFPLIRYPSIGLNAKPLKSYRAGYPFDPAVLRRLEAMNFNIIHSHCPIVSTVMARMLRDIADIPIVFTYHTKFDVDINNTINGALIRKAAVNLLVENIKACDEVWVVSRGAGENLKSLGYKGDFIVMENGVDLSKGRAGERAVEKLREAYNIAPGLPVFLFVGRMMWYKGLKLLLDGLAAYKNRCKTQFKMVFVGDGADKDEVMNYAEKLSLNGDCIFTGAIRDREEMKTWYSLADILLFPSTFDTNGLVVREAAACGLPSLLIEGSCAAEGVTDGRTGLLIQNEPEAMTAALEKITANIDLLKTIGKAAMDEIYISWDESIRHAVERYNIVLDNWESTGRRRVRLQTEDVFDLSDKMIDEIESMKKKSAFLPERIKLGRRLRQGKKKNIDINSD